MQCLEGGAHVSHGVQDVGADDEIVRVVGKPLIFRRFLQIEDFVFDLWEGGQFLISAGEKPGGDVGEDVGMQAAVEQRQHLGGETGGTGSDFEEAQASAFGQLACGFLDGAGDAGHPVTGEQAVSVELIEQFGAGAAEEDLHGVFFAAQNRAEFGAGGCAEQAFREVAGMFEDEIAQGVGCGSSGGVECWRWNESVWGGGEQASADEAIHEPCEDGLHGWGDPQRAGVEAGVQVGAGLMQSVGELGSREGIFRGHHGFQFFASPNADNVIEGAGGHLVEPGQRNWSERGRGGGGGEPFPIHMVQQVAAATGSAWPAGGGHADGTESVDEHAGAPGFVIEGDPSLDEFFVEVEDAGIDAAGSAG